MKKMFALMTSFLFVAIGLARAEETMAPATTTETTQGEMKKDENMMKKETKKTSKAMKKQKKESEKMMKKEMKEGEMMKGDMKEGMDKTVPMEEKKAE